jgi:hypothetical protein
MYGSWQHQQHNGDVEFWRKAMLNNVDGNDMSYDKCDIQEDRMHKKLKLKKGCPKF